MCAIERFLVQDLYNSDRLRDKATLCTCMHTFSTLREESCYRVGLCVTSSHWLQPVGWPVD